MKKLKTVLLLTVITVITPGILQAGRVVSVKSMPPSVVKTVPQAGDLNVDPALKEIKVTFSKDMMTNNMWSWCMLGKSTFPELDRSKKIHYLQDRRTCVMPVKLKPDKSYVIWINTQKMRNFKDTNRIPAVPYLLVFKTAAEKQKK